MSEDIPFTTFVDLPGIDPGDQVAVAPVVEHVGFDLLDKVWVDCSDSRDDDCDDLDDARPVFRRLLQRTVILLIVTGSQEEPIRIAQAPLSTTALAPATTC